MITDPTTQDAAQHWHTGPWYWSLSLSVECLCPLPAVNLNSLRTQPLRQDWEQADARYHDACTGFQLQPDITADVKAGCQLPGIMPAAWDRGIYHASWGDHDSAYMGSEQVQDTWNLTPVDIVYGLPYVRVGARVW